ncbi:hypothetical protein WG908_03425 [Sphingobium sp. AN641]|uniref:hypothetical protein n=1 Tax=Sphingobium sp. AN641 TaxID=3133443 RepID=UPI0030BE9372
MYDINKTQNDRQKNTSRDAIQHTGSDVYFGKLSEIVRHLARISAENDYNVFVNEASFGYNEAPQGGTSS